jgi:hypothetical protein
MTVAQFNIAEARDLVEAGGQGDITGSIQASNLGVVPR